MTEPTRPEGNGRAMKREMILASARNIQALPSVLNQALDLAQDSETSMADLARTIEFDPGLTSNVLRLANSAYFGGGNIGSLRDALVRLGQRRVFQILLTSSLQPMAQQSIKGYGLPPGYLLTQSIAVAVASEQLATALKRPVPPYAFTAGLLHDVGKVVLGTFLSIEAEPILKLARENKISFDEAERQVLGIDHAETGAALLACWQLPHVIVEAVRWHHQPELFTDGDPFIADLIHVADALTIESGIGSGVDGLSYRPSQIAVERLGMRSDTAERVVCEMLAGLSQLCDALNIDLGR